MTSGSFDLERERMREDARRVSGIRFETNFVDEGSETLDEEAMDKALETLMTLDEGGRLVFDKVEPAGLVRPATGNSSGCIQSAIPCHIMLGQCVSQDYSATHDARLSAGGTRCLLPTARSRGRFVRSLSGPEESDGWFHTFASSGPLIGTAAWSSPFVGALR